MKKTNKTLLSTAIAAALMLAASGAMAQNTTKEDEVAEEPENTAELSEVTVTARRREETLQEVPVAVTAFTETALEEFNIEDLGDLDAYVPNLTIYSARGSSSTITAYIRGVGQSDPLWGVDPAVGLYIDDVYMARPQGGLLDVVDVERVEVLRGPQGTLYGKNTTGGAIKYITKPLKPDVEGAVSLGVGSYDQLDVKASLNAPLGSDAVVGRMSVASLNRDGFGENTFTGQDVSDKEILVARGSVGFYPTEDFNVILSADWLDDQSGVRGAKRLNAFNPLDPARTPPLDDRYDIRSGMSNVNDTTLQGASATANWTINESWWFKSITAYRESETDTNIDFDTLPNKIVDVRATYEDDQTSQEFQLNYVGERLDGVIGFYYFDGSAGGTVFNNFVNASFGTTNGQVETESYAFYGEGTWQFNEQWALTFGARFTDETKKADVLNQAYRNANFNPADVIATPADFEDEVDFQNISPKVSLDYQVTEDVLIYALGTRGFKSGGFNIRANVTAFPLSARPFDDEQVTSFEVGTKTAWFDDRLYVNASYFHNDYEDIQLSIFTGFDSNGDGTDDAFFGDFTNAGKATVSGVEIEMAANLTDNWTVNGNIAFLDAEYDEFITRNVNVADTQKFTNAPERSGALSTQYTWGDVFGGALSARGTVTYQDEVYPTTDLSEVIKQPGYSLLSAGLIWRSNESPWVLSLQGPNLTDKEYRTTGYNIAALGILTGFYGAPRQYTLTATYLFD